VVDQGPRNGAHCLIWDCNSEDEYPQGVDIRRRMLKWKQRNFLDSLSKTAKGWIGGGGNKDGGICVQATAAFVVSIMAMGPKGFPIDSKEWEALGYRRVHD